MSEPIDQVLQGLALAKKRIAMTDEMARRVGISSELARQILAIENIASRTENRPVSMENVAKAIVFLSESEETQ